MRKLSVRKLSVMALSLFILSTLVTTVLAQSPGPGPDPTLSTNPANSSAATALMTCYAEPKAGFLIDVRRGPNHNTWGALRQMDRLREHYEMRVFGQDSSGLWFHVVLPPPYESSVGWVYIDDVNLYGVCSQLPVTDAEPQMVIEDVPPAPAAVPLPAAFSDVVLTANDRAFLVKPGILYIRRQIDGEQRDDDLQAHLLLMDLTAPQLRVTADIGAIPDLKAMPVSQIALEAGAFAAINGDYYSGNYMPQNITVIDGEVVTAPKHRAAFALTPSHEPFIGYFAEGWTWGAYVVAANGEVIPLQLMNLPCDPAWLCIYSSALGEELSLKYSGLRVLLNEDFEVVEMVDNRRLEIPEGHYVLLGGSDTGTGAWLREHVALGDQLQVNLLTDPDWQQFETAIGGGPRIMLDGEFWQDCDPEEKQPTCEEFDERYRQTHYYDYSIPRSAIGYSEDGQRLIVIMVEGYEVADSQGMTQRELAALFSEFGGYQAMEFDGGGSSTLWMAPGGTLNDFGPSGERPISNALLFFWED